MKDKPGRDIKQGAWVDIYLSGMFTGYVSEVHDMSVLAEVPQRTGITLTVVIPMMSRDGRSVPVYLIKEPDQETLDMVKGPSQIQ